MTPPSASPRAARAFTLVEALLAFAVSLVLVAVLYTLLVSSRKGMARGEGKLEYLGEANLLFQSLKHDVQALAKPPVWNAATGELKLDIFKIRENPYVVLPQSVSYRLEGGTIRRQVAGSGPEAEQGARQFGYRKVKRLEMKSGKLFDADFLAVRVAFAIEADNFPTEFGKSLFFRNLRTDRTWNPVEP